MALTKEQLQQLIRLQEQDKVLDSIQASIDKVPADIQSIRTAMEAEKSHLAEIKAKSTKLQLGKKEKELELSQKEEAVRKHSQELNSIKTNDAYKALQSEIDKAKAAAGDLETVILTLMDEIDHSSKEEKAELAKLKEVETKGQQQIQALEAQLAQLNAKIAEERTKRDGLATGFPADLMKLYDYLRKRKQGIALAVVKGNMCGGCRMTILPQSLVEIAKGTKLVTCESCQRILYQTPAPAATGEGGTSLPVAPGAYCPPGEQPAAKS